MGKQSSSTSPLKKRTSKEISTQRKIIEEKVKQEKKLIDKFSRDFEKRKKTLFKKIDIKQVSSLIHAEKKLYDAAFKGFKGNSDQLERLRSVARKTGRSQLIKKSPAIRKIWELYSGGTKELHGILYNPGRNVFNPDLNPEFATEELLEYQVFEPPFAFRDAWDTANFDYDYSLSFLPWGLLLTDIEFSHSQDWAEALMTRDESYKYAIKTVGLGVHYVMPRNGDLEITFVVRNLRYDVDFSITDNVGPSSANFEFSNIFLMSAEGLMPSASKDSCVVEEPRSSSGDNKHGKIDLALPDPPLFLKLKTTQGFSSGEHVSIIISSSLRIMSHVVIMDTKITANTLWQVEKIYVKVVE